MSKPISISHISMLTDEGHMVLLNAIHGEETMAMVEAHEARTYRHWRTVGSNASTAEPQSSSVMPGADLSSRVPAAGHGGPYLEAMA